MKEKVRFLGLDVHAETITAAVAEPDGEVRSLGTIANRVESIRKRMRKLGPVEPLRACYEAGPTGYIVYLQLAALGVTCEVIAPTLMPMKAGDWLRWMDGGHIERQTGSLVLAISERQRYQKAADRQYPYSAPGLGAADRRHHRECL